MLNDVVQIYYPVQFDICIGIRPRFGAVSLLIRLAIDNRTKLHSSLQTYIGGITSRAKLTPVIPEIFR